MDVAIARSAEEVIHLFIPFVHPLSPFTHFINPNDFLKVKSFWSWRENLPKSIVSTAPTSIHFDVSMPLPVLYTLVEDTRAWLNEKGWLGTETLAVYGYGHVGDGNLHLSISAAKDEEWLRNALDNFVYEWTGRFQTLVTIR